MEKITVATTVDVPIEQAWEEWTAPEHIKEWCHASPDWHAPDAENDLRVGGTFKTVMAARDGSQGFDFTGTYTNIMGHERIAYTMDDGRDVEVVFESLDGGRTKVIETFEPESENSSQMQREGWQAILDNFKAYAEREGQKFEAGKIAGDILEE